MTKKKPRPPQGKPLARYGLIALVTIVLIAGAGYFILGVNRAPAPIDPNAADVAAALPRSETAFNVSTRVGQSAPAFSLTDAQGKPYTFKPGDGRKYVLAFNMGFV